MTRTSILLLSLALSTACVDHSTAPIVAPDGTCGGIEQVKSWDVTFQADFTASDTVNGHAIVLRQNARTNTLRADSLDLTFAPQEISWRGRGSAGTVSIADTATAGAVVDYRITADHVPIDVMQLDVIVDLTACTIALNTGYAGVASTRWPGVPDYVAPSGVGSFTTGQILLPVSEFRYEGFASNGAVAVPARNLDQWNLFPATAQYIPVGLGGLFPYEHDFGTATMRWTVRPRW